MALRVNFYKVRKYILTVILFLSVFAGGYYLGVSGYKAEVNKALEVKINRTTPPETDVDFGLFWQVWDTLSSKYFDKTKLVPSEMVYGAIAGMVDSLKDPYTMFLPPKENKVVDEDLSGSFEGVGIEIGFRGTRLAVISPLEDSPAEAAGVKAGDYIVNIKDVKKDLDLGTVGINISEAVQAIRGPAGSVVTLTLMRDGDDVPLTVDITRAKLNIPSVKLEFVGENKDIAHLKIAKFGGDTMTEWDEKVSEVIKASGVNRIILDLRNNPGGYMQAAVDIAADFVRPGSVVVMQDDGKGNRQEVKSEGTPRLGKYKVLVLINAGSASASEILAGALRDVLGVKLVGEKSFGKGTIQEPLSIPGGSGLHVTTAKWLTPKGTWVHDAGLEPDVKVEITEKDTEDVQLKKAIELF